MQDNIFAFPAKEPVGLGHALQANLPAQLTPLIGREQEVAAVCTLLRRPEVRLLTLCGTGGVGKTRLGLHVARTLLDDFSDGVCYVVLAPISDPTLVVPTIVKALELKETGTHTPLDELKSFLQNKHLLLFLDNFEQVITAARPLMDLLTWCPGLKLLVTSRTRLHVYGEHEFLVPPLSLPAFKQLADPEVLEQYAAVALFVQRAQAVKRTFQLTASNARTVAEICICLDGLPLAIELAAARINVLSPQALLTRLSHRLQVLTRGPQNVPERQHTMRNTITWSYDLLSADEQKLFRRLATFVGSCTLEAIEALCTALDSEAEEVLDGVTSLLDKCLLQAVEQDEEEPRLCMLETIREYGLECLATSGETEVARHAHAVYYLQLAREAAQNWFGAQEHAWLQRLEWEHDNLRAAMNCLLEHTEARVSLEMALDLGTALWWFWLVMGHCNEGWSLLELALEGSEGVAVPIHAHALWATGNLAGYLGHFERGEVLCQESLVLFRAIGDRAGMGTALFHLAEVAYAKTDLAAARSRFEESLVLSREVGNKAYTAWAYAELAWVALYQGEYARVDPLVEEGLVFFRELGIQTGNGITYSRVALVYAMFFQGDLARAHTLAEECLASERESGNKAGEAHMLALLGEITLHQGDPLAARLLLEKSYALLRQVRLVLELIDGERQMAVTLSLLGKVLAAQGNYPAARVLYEKSLKSLIRVRGVNSNLPFVDLAAVLEGLAVVVAAQEELAWAVRLWGAAEAQRLARGTPLPPVYRAVYEHSVTATRAQLGEKPFAVAWTQGRTMTLEHILAAQGSLTILAPVLAEPVTVSPVLKAPTYPDGLTVREVEVLRLVAQGLTDARVAEQLMISPRTVNAHLKAIYGKIQVSSRSAATRYALEHHLS